MIQQNIQLKRFTTFKIGGRAQYFAAVKTLAELKQAYQFARQNSLPFFILGAGSNMLISDEGVPGLVVLIKNTGLKFSGTAAVVGAGFELDKLVEISARKNLRGLENLSGIPGTVGGAVYGNAGAWGKSLSDAIARVWFYDGEQMRVYEKAACEFSYRDSVFKKLPGTIWQVELDLAKGNATSLLNLRSAILAYRAKRYPKTDRSAGSFFKNVSSDNFSEAILQTLPKYAFSGKEVASGYLIESAGLLGESYQGARIAFHQGNYLLNFKGATSTAVIKLVKHVRNKVFKKFNVVLEPEVQLLGFKDNPFK